MTAQTKDTKHDQYGAGSDEIQPKRLSFPVAAATTLFGGSMCGLDANGRACASTAFTASTKIQGQVMTQVVNTVAAGFGAAGDLSVDVQPGVFYYVNSAGADAIAQANIGSLCYVVDDQTVALTPGAGTRPVAGIVMGIGSPSSSTAVAVWLGASSPYVLNPLLTSSLLGSQIARNVVTANVADLAVFTVAGNDGVTNIATDLVILSAQTTAAQNGPYIVGTVGGGTAALTRPDWFATGSTQKQGLQIKVGPEGTVFKNTTWQSMNAAAQTIVVGTTDAKFYPLEVSGTTALVAGTFTISTVPVFSVKSAVLLNRAAANTCAATDGGYHPTVAGATGITPGVIGTAAVVVQATVLAGTINNADISTLHWTIKNQA